MKSFRGLLVDGDIDTIPLATNTGSTGYKITKFQIMAPNANVDIESVVKIYSVSQTTADGAIDFEDNTLLAAGIIRGGTGASQAVVEITIFDNVKFNQDIYVTLKGADYTSNVNYYIELEQSKLSLDENTVATLKDIRNIESQYV